MLYYHGSVKEITEFENGEVMFFTADEDEAAAFAESKASECELTCYLYKINIPDGIELEEINDFGLFDCAYKNREIIKGDGWICPQHGMIALLNPGNYPIELLGSWESANVQSLKDKYL